MLIHYFPRLYELFINTIHPPTRYELAGEIIGNGSVLDIGCGTGLLANYLSPKANYKGIDLNTRLLGYAERKGLNVEKMDCKEVKKFPDVDVYFICDLLHHINPDHGKFIKDLVATYPDRTIIACEPYVRGGWFKEQMAKLADYDYVNDLWRPDWYRKDDLYEFFRTSLEADRIREIKYDLVGVNEGKRETDS